MPRDRPAQRKRCASPTKPLFDERRCSRIDCARRVREGVPRPRDRPRRQPHVLPAQQSARQGGRKIRCLPRYRKRSSRAGDIFAERTALRVHRHLANNLSRCGDSGRATGPHPGRLALAPTRVSHAGRVYGLPTGRNDPGQACFATQTAGTRTAKIVAPASRSQAHTLDALPSLNGVRPDHSRV